MNENINIPVKVGDTILMGKFKNKRVVVKSIGKDEYGMPTINGKKVVTFRMINEDMSMSDLRQVDSYADRKMGMDVVLTDRHFFDRLNDPRNQKEILDYELMDFFDKLSDNKEKLLQFLQKYKDTVVTDNNTNINIPFMKRANQIIAKTIMRKFNFKSRTPKLYI